MGVYNEIWKRVKEFEDAEKERKKELREKKLKELSNPEEDSSIVEDQNLCDESVEGEQEKELAHISNLIDYRIIKEYTPPLFNPGKPNEEVHGAVKKYKDRFGKYLALIDCVKFYRSSKYCSILALATTSSVLLSIWGSPRNISNALSELEKIGLITEYDGSFQTGFCKRYCYYIEVEKQLIQHCKEMGIPKFVIENRQQLTPKQKIEYQRRCNEVYSKEFKDKVLFKSKLTLNRPKGVTPEKFKSDLYEMLYENYPAFKIYQQMTEEINRVYYKDQPEFHIRFKPKFHWNANKKKEKSKSKTSIVGIGIRASNKLCSAKKDNDVADSNSKKILREEVLSKYGFEFEQDITSSVPRVAYALTYGGWLKDDVDLYEKIYNEIEPAASREDFEIEREAIKKLFFRVYFDSTDNKLACHTWNKMNQNGIEKEAVYNDMIKLRRAVENVLGCERYNNYIFYVESCIYIDTLHTLLKKGYKVWLVYDCFYGAGFGSKEEFKNTVLEAVYISFVRFKMAHDFNDWDIIQY